MVLETLRYADEVNKAASYFRDIGDAKPDEELLELAETLIQKKTAPFDASVFHDRYIDALKDLVQRKLKAKGGKVTPEAEPARPSGSNVVDLMAEHKKSLEKPEVKAPATTPTARQPPTQTTTAKHHTPATPPTSAKKARPQQKPP